MADMNAVLGDIFGGQNPYDDNANDPPHDNQPVANVEVEPQNRTLKALKLLKGAGIKLSDVIDDVLLGDESIRGDKAVVAARTEVYSSSVLTRVLERTRKTEGMRMRGNAHKTAAAEIESWAIEAASDVLKGELTDYAKTTKAQETEIEVVSEESLERLTFEAIHENVIQRAPRLYNLLASICKGPRQERNKQKDPTFCIVMFVNALAYQLSQYNNAMQKLLCVYFKAKDVPKSIYHLFQQAGLVMSYSWSVTALSNISDAAMKKAIEIFESQPCIAIYDNIRLPFPVKHQRGDNLTVTDNGTAITITPMRNRELAESVLCDSSMLQEHRTELTESYRAGTAPQLSPEDIYEIPGFLDSKSRTLSNLRCFLFSIPQLRNSTKRMHRLLAPLPPVHQLPFGRDHITRQYMLETVPMEEQTYGGNYALMKEIPRQLAIDTPEKLHDWARTTLVPFKGDVLTTQRLRGVQQFKAGDSNSFERLEHVLPVFGWFHLDMNLCNAIFYHHYAESSFSGLARDAAALHRSGLTKPTKERGPQYHTVDEFLQHTTSARVRLLWMYATGCESIESLVSWVENTPPETIALTAETIWNTRVSNRALEVDGVKDDPRLCNTITLTRDLLLRHEVRDAMRHGDVGRMEHTLPTLLVFFAGAGSKNYAREIADVLHWRRYEAPPGVANLIRDECWLINTRGRPDTFYPLDLRQELNNLSIKEHGPPAQGCTWAAHQKWSPALPILAGVVQHIDENFHDFYRSRKHHVPDAEPDQMLLLKRQLEQKIYHGKADLPKPKQEEPTTDCMELGHAKVFQSNYLEEISRDRIKYMSQGSTLQRAEHQGMTIEEALAARIAGHKQKAANSSHILPLDLDDTEGIQRDDMLHYGDDTIEEREQMDTAYEENRHNLMNNWNV